MGPTGEPGPQGDPGPQGVPGDATNTGATGPTGSGADGANTRRWAFANAAAGSVTAGQFDASGGTLYIHKTDSFSTDVSSWLQAITPGAVVQAAEAVTPAIFSVFRITSEYTLTGDVFSWT
jgi:hypothetical protein